MIEELISLANDNLVTEPLTALHIACLQLGADMLAPRATQDDAEDLFRLIELDGKKFTVSFNGEQWAI